MKKSIKPIKKVAGHPIVVVYLLDEDCRAP